MPKRIARFKVTMELPDSLSVAMAQEYVLDALKEWRGQYFPGSMTEDADPRFEINRKKIRVARIRRGSL